MKYALLFLLWAGAAQAGTEYYDQCLGAAYEPRVLAKYAERFTGQSCESLATCDMKLLQSAVGLVRAECRAEALAQCETAACRDGLQSRWQADAASLRQAIDARLTQIDLTALPALQQRRLGNADRWFTPSICQGDAVTCAAQAAGRALGDLERIDAEIGQLN